MGKTGKILRRLPWLPGHWAASRNCGHRSGLLLHDTTAAKTTGKEILELFREGPEEQNTAKEKPEQCASAEATPEKQENVPVKDGTAEVVSSEERTETERDEKD